MWFLMRFPAGIKCRKFSFCSIVRGYNVGSAEFADGQYILTLHAAGSRQYPGQGQRPVVKAYRRISQTLTWTVVYNLSCMIEDPTQTNGQRSIYGISSFHARAW